MFSAARARIPVSACKCDRRAGGDCTETVAVATPCSDDTRAADVSGLSTEVAGSVVDTQSPRGIYQSGASKRTALLLFDDRGGRPVREEARAASGCPFGCISMQRLAQETISIIPRGA